MNQAILETDKIHVRYSGLPVLQGVSIRITAGETVCVVGSNGAGKSTLLRAIMGAQRSFDGRILYRGNEIQRSPTEEIVRLGIVYVPEEKMLFKPLSVARKYSFGRLHSEKTRVRFNVISISSTGCFLGSGSGPIKRRSTLSGGEQQMVAIGRGLMSRPAVLMLDEPSLGLAPLLVDEVLDTVRRLKAEGITILLVEQNVREALDLADRGYVMQTGRIVEEGSGKELLESDRFRKAFLGI